MRNARSSRKNLAIMVAAAAAAVMQAGYVGAADQWLITGSPTSGSPTDISNVNNYSPAPGNLTDGTQDLLFAVEATAPSTLLSSINIDGLQFATSSANTLTNAWNYTGGAPTITIGAGGITDYAQKTVTFSGPVNLALSQNWITNNNTQVNNPITFAGVLNASSGVVVNKNGSGYVAITNASNQFSNTSGFNLYNGTLSFKTTGSMTGLAPGSISIASSSPFNANGTLNANNLITIDLGITSSDSTISNTFLNTIAPTSNFFIVGMGAGSSNNLDFTGTNGGQNLSNAILGAFTAATYSGTITPAGNTYRFGGSNNTLTVTSPLSGGNNVTIYGNTTLNNAANSFTGVLTLNGNMTASNVGSLGTPSAFNMGQGQLTISSGSLTTSNPVNFIGSTNGFNVNGNSMTLNGPVTESGNTGAVGFSNFANVTSILTLGGSADNTGLALNFGGNNGILNLNKNSGPSVHAIGLELYMNGGGNAAPGQLIRITGSGGDQINDAAYVEAGGTYTTFDLNGHNEGFDTLYSNGVTTNVGSLVTNSNASSSTLTLGTNNGLSFSSGNNPAVYYGSLQNGTGTLALVKTGSGTQTLASLQNYSGGTTVNGGTLNIDFSSIANASGNPANFLIPTSSLVLNGGIFKVTGRANGAAYNVASGVSYSSGSTQINLPASATSLGLVAGQSVTGTNINTGSYILYTNGNQAFLNQKPLGNNGANFNVAGQAFVSSQSFTNGITLAGGASGLAANSNTSTGGVNLAVNAINRSTGATLDFTLPAVGSISTTNANANFSGGQQTILNGYATLGATTWAVSGSGPTAGSLTGLTNFDSNFTAGTDVEAGGNNFSPPAATTINSLRFSTGGSTVSPAGNLNIATGGILETAGVGNNAVTISGGSITSGNGQDLIVIQNNNASSMTIGSAIVNPSVGSIGFTKSGPGPVALSGSNTYTGPTTINAGTVTVTGNGTLGNGSSAVVLRSTGSLILGVSNQTQIPLNSQAGTAVASSIESNPAFQNDVSASNAFDGDPTTRWSSQYADPQWLEIDLGQAYPISSVALAWETATGKNFVFQVSNSPGSFANGPSGTTSAGWTTVGTFTNQNPASSPAIGGTAGTYTTYNLSAATARYLGFYGSARVSNQYGYSIWEMQAFELGGGIAQNYSIGSLASPDSTTGVVLNPSVNLVVGSDNSSTSFAGVVSGYGGITKVGSGTLTLTNVNTHFGNTNISSGSIQIGNALALENSTVVLSGGNLNLNGLNATIGGLGGSGNLAIPASGVLTIGNNNFTTSYSGSLNGSGSTLVKIGSGMQTLSAASTYTGGTNSSSGAIAVTNITGSATGTGPVTVGPNGTLGGNGIISGVVTATGTVQPGVANPSVTNLLTIGSGSSLTGTTVMDLTSANFSDEILFGSGGTGSAILGGSLNVASNTSLATGQSYDLFAFNSSNGSFGTLHLPTLANGLSWVTTNLYSTGMISITGTAIGAANLTWNSSGGSPADGTTWDTTNQNWNNGTSAAAYSDNSNSSSGDNVTFNDANNGNYNVNISGTVHPTSVNFNNSSGGYNLTGGSIAGATSLTKFGTGTVSISSSNTYTGGTFINNGKLILASAAAFPANTNLSIGSTATSAAVVFAAHPGSTVNVLQVNNLTLAGGTGAWTGQLDLTNNAMVLHNASIGTVFNQLQQGINGGGNWNGTGGMISSSAAGDTSHLTALGVIINDTGANTGAATGTAIYPSFDTASSSAGDVLVKYTYYGDANLSGTVDGSDYSLVDNGYLNHLTGWYNGDFNYDGTVNGSDYTLLDNAFNTQGASLTALIASPTDQLAGSAVASAVPEPAVLSPLVLGAAALLRRRRRQPTMS